MSVDVDMKLAARHHRERWRKYGFDLDALVVDDGITWDDLLAKTAGNCVIKGCADEPTEVGHIRSVAHGGGFTAENLAPICREHNRMIGAADITQLIMDHGRIEDGERLVHDVVDLKMQTAGISRDDALVSTLYALSSWHSEAFAQIGISAYTGPPGSGKSTCMKIDAAVGSTEDGQILGAMPSEASLRDQISSGNLVAIDEVRKVTPLVSAMLNSSYDRSQSRVAIKSADGSGGFEDRTLDLFGPRVMGGAFLILQPDTMTRVLGSRLAAMPHDPDAPSGWQLIHKLEALRERALRWNRQTKGAIPRFDLRDLPEHVAGRSAEIWSPLIKTASIISDELESEVRTLAEQHAIQHQAEPPRSAFTVWHANRIYADDLGEGVLEKNGAIKTARILCVLHDDKDLPEYGSEFDSNHLWGHLNTWGATPARNRENVSIYYPHDWTAPKSGKSGGGLFEALRRVLEQYETEFPNIIEAG